MTILGAYVRRHEKHRNLFMKTTIVANVRAVAAMILVCVALSGPCGTTANAQTPPNLPPGVQDVVRLSKAGLSENIILSKVRQDGVSYNLTTDQIIYLKNQGVPESVIGAMVQGGSAGAPPAPASTPSAPPPAAPPQAGTAAPSGGATMPPPPPAGPPEAGAAAPESAPAPAGEPVANFESFQQQLSPYGTWVNVPGYGECWQPYGLPNGWRPYYDNGYWVYTDAGMYWQSNYPWGAIPFHYGRWMYVEGNGWIWAPAYEYAPAWVFWRHSDGYLGWAPLPYGAVFVDGGWMYRGRRFGVDFDFGYGANFFIFVGYGHLWEHDYRHFTLRGPELRAAFRVSVINGFHRDEHGRFVAAGFDRQHLERLTGRSITVARNEDLRNRERESLRTDRERVTHGGARGEQQRREEPAARDRDHGDHEHDHQGP